MKEGQERSRLRKRVNQTLDGLPYQNQLIGDREGVKGHYVDFHLNDASLTLNYHAAGGLDGLVRTMPLRVRWEGKFIPVKLKKIARPKYNPEIGHDNS